MVRGKNINLFLMDGDVNGRIKGSIANWTGVVYKIPRTELDKCKNLNMLKQSGVYMLFGTDEETFKDVVYIGQAGERKNGEGILTRLSEHRKNPDKNYWNDAVVFTTQNNSFGPTEISYLENTFCNLAVKAGRYEVKNGNEPTPGNLTEEKESEMEEFVDYAKLVIGAIGYKVFVPYVESVHNDNQAANTADDNVYYAEINSIHAECRQTSEGFVVLAGSQIYLPDASYCPKSIKKLRNEYKLSKLISEDGILQKDILFKSPSYAGVFVYGRNVNGKEIWKDSSGRSLKEKESEK